MSCAIQRLTMNKDATRGIEIGVDEAKEEEAENDY